MTRTLGSHRFMYARRSLRPRPRTVMAIAGVVAVLASGCSNGPLVVHGPGQASSPPGSSQPPSSSAPPGLSAQPGAHVATAPRGLRRSAELDVVNGATSVSVSTAKLGSELLRVTTPPDSGIRPDLVIGNSVQLYLDATGGNGPAAVQVVLNSAVTWRLLFAGGANQTSANLSGGRFAGADFAAGSSLITMTLPRPSGTTTVQLSGGASQVSVGLPAGVPAQLRLLGGASSAILLGHTYTGIAGGTVLTSPGWSGARARYLINAPAGVSTINVTD